MLVGLVLTVAVAMTVSLPLIASELLQPKPLVNDGRFVTANAPWVAALVNNCKGSFNCKAATMLLNVGVPPKEFVPAVSNRSLLGVTARLTSIIVVPPSVAVFVTPVVFATVRVPRIPTDAPGERVELLAVVRLPRIVPLPLRVWPATTTTKALDRAETSRIPPSRTSIVGLLESPAEPAKAR